MNIELTRCWSEEYKKRLWSKSPYRLGEKVCFHPDYKQISEELEIIDISLIYGMHNFLLNSPRNGHKCLEYNCKYPDGRTEWLKWNRIVRPNDTVQIQGDKSLLLKEQNDS